jgi:hypothetical protein
MPELDLGPAVLQAPAGQEKLRNSALALPFSSFHYNTKCVRGGPGN